MRRKTLNKYVALNSNFYKHILCMQENIPAYFCATLKSFAIVNLPSDIDFRIESQSAAVGLGVDSAKQLRRRFCKQVWTFQKIWRLSCFSCLSHFWGHPARSRLERATRATRLKGRKTSKCSESSEFQISGRFRRFGDFHVFHALANFERCVWYPAPLVPLCQP